MTRQRTEGKRMILRHDAFGNISWLDIRATSAFVAAFGINRHGS
jgi:hypothetical protein